MVTPFDKRGEVGLHATEAVVKRLIEAGVDGIPALGSTGEFSHLTNHNSAYRFPGRAWSRPARPGGGAREDREYAPWGGPAGWRGRSVRD